jgi:hypothetical protein
MIKSHGDQRVPTGHPPTLPPVPVPTAPTRTHRRTRTHRSLHCDCSRNTDCATHVHHACKVNVSSNIPFATAFDRLAGQNVTLKLDLYTPDTPAGHHADAARPAAVVIHGGGWHESSFDGKDSQVRANPTFLFSGQWLHSCTAGAQIDIDAHQARAFCHHRQSLMTQDPQRARACSPSLFGKRATFLCCALCNISQSSEGKAHGRLR